MSSDPIVKTAVTEHYGISLVSAMFPHVMLKDRLEGELKQATKLLETAQGLHAQMLATEVLNFKSLLLQAKVETSKAITKWYHDNNLSVPEHIVENFIREMEEQVEVTVPPKGTT